MTAIPGSNLVIATVTAGAKSLLLGSDSHRQRVIFLPSKTGDYVVGDSTIASQATGFAVTTSTGPIEINTRDHGDVVQRDWFCFSSAGVTQIPIIVVVD